MASTVMQDNDPLRYLGHCLMPLLNYNVHKSPCSNATHSRDSVALGMSGTGNGDSFLRLSAVRTIASAVEFLHIRAKIVHRDIKDENIILDGQGVVKLIDFGSASYLKNGPFDVFVGTIDYAAPEVLAGASYDGPAQDVWAMGILLYTILYKENPFYSIDEIMDHDLRVPYLISEASIDLVRRMLNREVDKRPTITEIVRHEWCQGGRELKGNKDWRKGSGIAIVESERKI